MKKLVRNLIPLVTPTLIALAIYISFRPTSAESAAVNYGGGRIVYGGGGGGLTFDELTLISNIVASLSSSPTSGVALTAFNQLQLYTNGNQVGVRSGARLTNIFMVRESTNFADTIFTESYYGASAFAVTNRYVAADYLDEVIMYDWFTYDGNNAQWGQYESQGSRPLWDFSIDTGIYSYHVPFTVDALITASNLTVTTLTGSGNNIHVTPAGVFSRTNITGGSGTPGGNSGAIQFNEGGVFAGTNDLIFDRTNHALQIVNMEATPGTGLGNSYIYLGGSEITPYYSIISDSNWFRLAPDIGTSGTLLSQFKANKSIVMGSTANNIGTNIGDWYFPSNTYFLKPVTVAGGIQSTGSTGGSFTLTATNDIGYLTKVANSNAVSVTNIIGIIELATGSPIFINANFGHKFVFTNRATAAMTLVLTNTAPGQEISITLAGEVSGGTSRVITMIPHLTQLIIDQDDFSVAPSVSSAITLTNGNMVEFNLAIDKVFGATNIVKKVSRQAKL